MKTVFAAISFVFILFAFSNCEKSPSDPGNNPKIEFLMVDEPAERGIWGCGIPCPGTTLPPIESVCNKPNGICFFAEVMPPVDVKFDISADLVQIELVGTDKIRFTRYDDIVVDRDALAEQVVAEGGPEYEPHVDAITRQIANNYFFPNAIPFSASDSKTILDKYKKEGQLIVIQPGEYPIKTDNERPFGYYEVNIKIQ